MKTFKDLIFTNKGVKNKKEIHKKLLAGQWCIMDYPELHPIHKSLNIINHPWKNSKYFFKSYNEKKELEKKAIHQFKNQLNLIHGESLSFRSWNIILSPWFNAFFTILLERIMLIDIAVKDHKITKVIFGGEKSVFISKNTSEFILFASRNTDLHDHITKKITEIYYPELLIENIKNINEIRKNKNKKKMGKKLLKYLVTHFYKLIFRKQKKVFHLLGKTFFNSFPILTKYKVLPYFLVETPEIINSYSLNQNLRNSLNLNITEGKMNILVNQLVREFLPRSFLEDYDIYKKKALQFFPLNPSDIYTFTGYSKDDIFKIYTAHHVNKMSYHIFQHGGGFGVLDINDEEDLITETADFFNTWGWAKTSNSTNTQYRVTGSDQLNKIKKLTCVTNSEIICPLSEWSPMIYRFFNGYHGHAQLDYFDMIKHIIDSLPQNISENFKLRLQPGKRGWRVNESLFNYGLKKNILNRKGTFIDDLRLSKIAFITTNSTTLLESLSSNIPTILFLDPSFYPINKFAKQNYDFLHKAGILHYDIDEALMKLKLIFDNPYNWWQSEFVQSNKNKFINKYALIS